MNAAVIDIIGKSITKAAAVIHNYNNDNNNTQDTDCVQDEDNHNHHHHHNGVFYCWDDVVRAHQSDMWSDIPAIIRHLGQNELDNVMKIYR
jgi:hypothetical protein